MVARVQAAQNNGTLEAAARQLQQQFSSVGQQQQNYQVQQQRQQQQQQLLQQQLLAQQQQNNEYEKMKRFSTNLDQVRFGSSGIVAPDQRFHQQQHQQVQAKPKLDLLSEQFTDQKLSQKLFNSTSYSPVSFLFSNCVIIFSHLNQTSNGMNVSNSTSSCNAS